MPIRSLFRAICSAGDRPAVTIRRSKKSAAA